MVKNTEEKQIKVLGFAVLLLAALLTLPFIGLGHFYTRGEPREALVAVSMLEQGNFILPMFQGEFAFKPPMLHWLVALFSLPQGYVSEFTARLPSTLAFISMSVGFFFFFARRYDVLKVFLAVIIMMTTFEVHRSAMTCRVDMVLTAFMVGGFMGLYRWAERDCRGLPWIGALLISGAILTKGPVGAILPCFALTVFLLIRGSRVLPILVALLKVALLSSILPLCWYVAAYQSGGERFLELVLEENFGRFLGKMSYESHEHGALYNIPMLLSGMLPWSLLAVLGLLIADWRRLRFSQWREAWARFRKGDRVVVWATVVTVCVFVFYCIPKSKRSVYLLPLYPFISLLLADYFIYLLHNRKKIFRGYALFVTWAGILFSILLLLVHFVDLNFLGDSRGARRLIMQLTELQQMPLNAAYVFMALLPAITAGIVWWKRRTVNAALFLSVGVWMASLLSLDGLLNPAIKNSVPDYRFAQGVRIFQPEGSVYFYRPAGTAEETVYAVTYYLNNDVDTWRGESELPQKGYIMLREANKANFEQVASENYRIRQVLSTTSEFTSFRGNLLLYEFEKL